MIDILSDKQIVIQALKQYAQGKTYESWTTGFMMMSSADQEASNVNGLKALAIAEEIERGAIPDLHN